MSRIGVQKVSVSSADFFTGVLPSTGSQDSATINVADFSSATLFISSSLVSGTGQTRVQVFVTPSIGGAFYLAKPAVTSSIGTNDNFIIDVNLANAAQLKAVFTEIGDTGAPSSISASLIMSHQRGATVDGSAVTAQTPISTLGDLIVGDASGEAIRFGIGTTGQVLTVVSGTTSWETPSGGGSAAPSGTGIVSVTTGSYDFPTSFASLLTAAGGATTTDVNNAVQQLDAKQAVYSVETVGNVTPSGVQTVGGVTPPDGSRVLLAAQTDPTENTFYTTYDGGGWFATSDSNDSTRLEAGSRVFCQTGDNAGQVYVLRTTGTVGLATAKTWQSLKDSMGASPRNYLSDAFTVAAWTIVAATSGNAGTSTASFETGGVGRITLDTTGAAGGITGPRIERALPAWDATARWCFRVRVLARLNTSGLCNFDLYVRDSAGTSYRTIEITAASTPGDMYLTGNGGIVVVGPTGVVPWNGTMTLEIRYDAGLLSYGIVSTAGIYTPITPGTAASLTFAPSHVGITGGVGVASVGYVEAIDPVIEVIR